MSLMPSFFFFRNFKRPSFAKFLVSIFACFGVLIGIFGCWKYWDNKRNIEASFLYEKFESKITVCTLKSKIDIVCVRELEPIVSDIKAHFNNKVYSVMASLKFASILHELHKVDAAKKELQWVIDKDSEGVFSCLAKLRLASIFIDEGSFDIALSDLSCPNDSSFYPLFADKKGDVYLAKGDYLKARIAYVDALKKIRQIDPYRSVVEFKLDALGGPFVE